MNEDLDYGMDGSIFADDLEGYEEAVALDEGTCELKILAAVAETITFPDKKTGEEINAPVINLVLAPQNTPVKAKKIYHTLWRPRKGQAQDLYDSAQDKIKRFLDAAGVDESVKLADLQGIVLCGNLGRKANPNDPTDERNFVKWFTEAPDTF
jgi:hypothetical protein